MNRTFGTSILLAATALAGVSTAAVAQESTGDEIIITALKRDTNLQDTPISISAITGDSIANSGVQSIADLNSSVPSLSFVDGGPSQRRVVIRGIQASGEPTVGTYYDETPVTGVMGAGNDAGGSTPELRLFDVERVEVLRGPQGTLYGSGSMGGTLRVIYRKPGNEFEGAVDTSLSATQNGGANFEGSAMLNVPIVQDKVAVRATGFYRNADGYIDNTTLGIKDINEQKNYGGRLLLRLTPTEALTIDAAAYINRSRTDTPSWTLSSGKYNSDALTRQPMRDDVELYSLTANYDFGGVVLTAAGSYMERDLSTVSDVSRFIRSTRTAAGCGARLNGGAANPCTGQQLTDYYALVDGQSSSALFPQQTMEAWTAELRLSSDGSGPFNWTVGGFFSDRDVHVENPQVNTDPVTGAVIYPLQIATSRYINDSLRQVAVFGQFSYDVTDRLNLTVGGRYFRYDKDINGETTLGSILVGAVVRPLSFVDSSEDGTAFKFNASYKITDDVLFYAEASQGFRPGGANQVIGLAQELTPYQSDSLWNYEAGLKTTLLDRKLTLNVDVFQIDWSDMQITTRTPNGAFAYIGNAGSARIRGLELEGSLRPVDGLSISGNLAYLDAKLTEDQPNAGTAVAPAAGFDGDRIPFVPKFTAGLSMQYVWGMTESLNGFFRVDANHVGGSWSDFRPAYIYTRYIDDYELANVRVGIEEADNAWGVYVFVNNLFNDTAITRSTSSAIAQNRTLVNSAAPRTIGLNLRTKF
ncbi:TonB-dependent receptor [Sphingosinicella soli]|uniref:Outer membrane receptor protein involved in Fe transport n=1 Tax=Sphingosinicella soli TaxID=333708 RepID=A0A7W7B319_9SPHN|nr:outer membrane receptor protein involved in Fe transport [Sphingosinicella soli]